MRRFITERCNLGQNNITVMSKFSFSIAKYKSQVVPALGRLRHKDQRFKVILSYVASLKPGLVT